jgi:DnaJ-class molecular chaperone
MTDHYSALGLRGSASLADIKKAFRQLAATYHLDRNSDPEAPARFRAVQQAYEPVDDTKLGEWMAEYGDDSSMDS